MGQPWLLPSSVKPIIITDAGFLAPWFSYILQLGWHFVGRLRHKNLLCFEVTSTWKLSSDYFEQATAKTNLYWKWSVNKRRVNSGEYGFI